VGLLIGVACLVVGAYCFVNTRRHSAYVNGLPPSVGNRQIKRRQRIDLWISVGLLTLGVWHLVRYFAQSHLGL
jgi:hypothetical protein